MLDSIPKDLNRPWEDPMPEAGERHLAQELRGMGASRHHTLHQSPATFSAANLSFTFDRDNLDHFCGSSPTQLLKLRPYMGIT